MLGIIFPMELGANPMRSTTPEAGECMDTETKPPGSAIFWPRTTSCPSRTMALAGAPVCCDRGMIITGAKGNRRMESPLVSPLFSGG